VCGGEHRVPPGMTGYQVGWKTAVMNFSDLAAKGVAPLLFMVSLGLPPETPVAVVEGMAQGFLGASQRYGASMLGGDTNEARDIVVSGLAVGVGREEALMRRGNGAKPGDVLACTGFFGWTALGFKALLEGWEVPQELRGVALAKVYRPEARVQEGVALASTGAVTGCIDSSDGLSTSLHDLSRAMGLGLVLEEVPLDPRIHSWAQREGVDPAPLALNGGEEYELVFTYPPEREAQVAEALSQAGCTPLRIGRVVEERGVWVRKGEDLEPLERGGWDHFQAD